MTRPKLNEQEIERKLRSAKAPQPPSHLLDRLKADIPERVTFASVHPERRPQRLWRNAWAVAASVLALVSMSYVMLRTIETTEVQQSAPVFETAARKIAAGQDKNVAAPQEQDDASKDLPVAALPKPAELRADFREVFADAVRENELAVGVDGKLERQVAASAPVAEIPEDSEKRANDFDGAAESGVAGGVVGGVVAQAPPPPAATPARSRDAAPEPVVAEAAALPLSKAQARLSRRMEAKTAGGGQFVDASADPSSTFGLRVADESWPHIRAALHSGSLPAPVAVREEEVINHFDYRDEPSRDDATLYAEAAPAMSGQRGVYVLRVGLRTRAELRAATVQVEFNPEVVQAWRLVGYQTAEGGGGSVTRADLPREHAVSALYELRLERHPAARQRLGAIRLKSEGKETSLQINGGDVAGSWAAAPSSLRLASLAGKWAEMLKGSPFAAGVEPRDLMRRAQQLGGELAGDAEVAEFAALIAQSARLMGE
jgi:hypothetical protein